MSTTVKVQIQQRIDTASAWTTANPTLLAGEVGWESDTKKYKIGDGSTAWASLAYAPGAGGYTAGTGVSISGSNVITASAVALTTVQTAANETAMLALTTQEGDVVVRSDENKSYVRNSGTAGSMADFTLLATPTDAVLSVNGNTGAITADQLAAAIEAASDSNTFTDADHTKLNSALTTSDLLDEDNFATDSATKAASQQSVKAYVDTADALKANLSGATFTGQVTFTGNANNVGVGVTPSAWPTNGDTKAVQIGAGFAAFGRGSGDEDRGGVAVNYYTDGSNNKYIANGHSTRIYMNDGNIDLQCAPSGTAGNNITFENSIRAKGDSSVELYYDGVNKAETYSNGFKINGQLQCEGDVKFDNPDNAGRDIRWDSSDDTLEFSDNTKAGFGDGNDLQIYHDGSHSEIDNNTGNLNIKTQGQIGFFVNDSEDGLYIKQNGAVELYYDNSKKFETVSWGARVTGTFEASTDIQVTDAGKFNAGSSNDLQIYHDGTTNYIDAVNNHATIIKSGTSDLFLQGNPVWITDEGNSHTYFKGTSGGAAELYWDGSKKLETTSSGVNVTGALTVDGAAIGGGGLSSDAQQNTVGGTNAGDSFTGTDANDNTLIGYDAGTAITTADSNTFLGSNAGKSTTTSANNVFVGYKAGEDNVTGGSNTYIGDSAGENCTNDNNTCIGKGAGAGTNGSVSGNGGNTCIGVDAGSKLTSGRDNVLIGASCGFNFTEAERCVFIGGGGTVYNHTTGFYNVGVGYGSGGADSTTSSYNTSIGTSAGANLTSGESNTLLGYRAGTTNSPSGSVSSGDNIICLGDNDVTDLYCSDTSISSSDKRDKTDVTDFTHGLKWINKLKPVTYRWDKRTWYNEYNEDGSLKTTGTPDGSKKKAKQNIGFLAQDVLAIEQADGFASKKDDMLVVNLNEDDSAYGLKYERLVPVLVNAIKELSAKIETLETKVAALEAG